MRLKNFILYFILFINYAAASSQPDVIVYTKLDKNTSNVILKRFRTLLQNIQYPDPFNYIFETSLEFSTPVITTHLNPNDRELLENIGDITQIDLKKSRFVFKLDNIYYAIQNTYSNLHATKISENTSLISNDMLCENVKVGAKKVTISLILVQKNATNIQENCFFDKNKNLNECRDTIKNFIPLFSIKINNPELAINSPNLLPIQFDMSITTKNHENTDNKSNIYFHLEKANYELANNLIKNNPEIVQLKPLEIEDIPPIKISVGSKIVDLPAPRIISVINQQSENIKKILLKTLFKLLQEGFADSAINNALSTTNIPNALWFGYGIYTGFSIKSISSVNNNLVEVLLKGTLCGEKQYLEQGESCTKSEPIFTPVREISDEQFIASKAKMTTEIETGENNLIISASENYINRIIQLSIQLGYWDEALKSSNIRLGPKKAFVVLDKEGDTGTLFIDTIYKLPFKYQAILMKKTLRFPLIYKVKIFFKNIIRDNNNIPIFVIKIADADLERKKIIGGIPEFNVSSSLGISFRKRLAKAIQEEGSKLIGKEIITFEIPLLKNLNLEEAKFYSDGFGRIYGGIQVIPKKHE